ncbi:MAG: hypothetical protein RLZZ326_3964 [Planctomycetota bacterium]|jgi:hypothetical protein
MDRRSIPKEVDMRILIATTMVLVVLASPAHAGPFRRRSTTTTTTSTRPMTSTTNTGSTGSMAPVRTVTSGGAQGRDGRWYACRRYSQR